MRKKLIEPKTNFLGNTIKYIHYLSPFKRKPDFYAKNKNCWVIPFDNSYIRIVVEYNIVTDSYLLFCKEGWKTYELFFKCREDVEEKLEEIINESESDPIMSMEEFNKFFKITISYDLYVNPDNYDGKFCFEESLDDKNIKVLDRETGELIEQLEPTYFWASRINDIEYLFNIYHNDLFKKIKEEIILEHCKEECKKELKSNFHKII